MNFQRMMNSTQLAQALGVCQRTVYNMMERGELPQGIQWGRGLKWFIEDVEEHLEKKRRAAIKASERVRAVKTIAGA